MTPAKALIALAGAAFAATLGWAVVAGDFLQEGAVLLSLPWGIVTLADLYLGFLLYAVLVFAVERSKLAAAFWALPIFVIGNLWAVIWIVVRWKMLLARLKGEPPSSSTA
jgi:hypothetical protein